MQILNINLSQPSSQTHFVLSALLAGITSFHTNRTFFEWKSNSLIVNVVWEVSSHFKL